MAESNNEHEGEPSIRTSGEMIAYGEQLVSQGIALRETNSRAGVQEGSRLIAKGEKYIARGNQMRSDLKTPFSPLQTSAYDPRSKALAKQHNTDDAHDSDTDTLPEDINDGDDDKEIASADSDRSAEGGKKKRKKNKKHKDGGNKSNKHAKDSKNLDDEDNVRATPIDSDVDDISSADNSLGLRPPRRSEFPLRNRVPDPDSPERARQKYSASRHPIDEMRDAFPAPIDPSDITRRMPPNSDDDALFEANNPKYPVAPRGYESAPPEKAFNRVIAVICRVIALLCGALAAVNLVTHHLSTDATVAVLAVGLIFLTFASIEEAAARRNLERR